MPARAIRIAALALLLLGGCITVTAPVPPQAGASSGSSESDIDRRASGVADEWRSQRNGGDQPPPR